MHITRRDTIRSVMMAAMLAPLARPTSLLAATSAADRAFILETVTPELRPFAARMLDGAGYPPIGPDNLAIARKTPPPVSPIPVTVPVQKRIIPGSKGQPDVTIYILNAKPGQKRPALLHTHGGGFIIGSAEASIAELQKLCLALDCTAITVEYRLAPETTYAGSLEDNYAGLKWLYDHADEVGAEPARIALVGESAGGGHAALLAIAARDRGEIPIAFQCLIYPMLDDRTGTSRPVARHQGTLIWTPYSNRFGWKSFLGVEPGGSTAPKGAVPARLQNFKGLAPAFIGVGSIDLFFDEDVEYARRLGDAGVPVELLVLPGAFHGFDVLTPDSLIAKQFNEAKVLALKRGLGIS
ncbi:alpha/beta hydrolase [Sphingobium sp. YR768]|uniref:alpha/beta hydrolase n=1 Tax=Sphingobium sp. YR768 TaxID=1884365 RepID=UPI0008B7B734|nr:alpha/beta hydrolase [Sphingobium sp. YR768]SES11161.1 Acetyl esterase/lipase [Sphingobium sp. YR768]